MDTKEAMSRTNSSQAMSSLFSAYADDEGDEDVDHNTSHNSSTQKDKSEITFDRQFSGSENEEEKSETEEVIKDQDDEDSPTLKKPKLQPRVTKLVSYHDIDDVEDQEGDLENDDDVGDDVSEVRVEASSGMNDSSEMVDDMPTARGESSEDGSVTLPPEPRGSCSRKLQEKVSSMYEKMIRSRVNMNENIQSKKQFRNPSIYEKLIEFCGIDEKGTNYPPELYDPSIWGPNSYYTELAKLQKEEMDKKEKERKDKTKIEFVSGVKKGGDSNKLNERRSKWDTQGKGADGGTNVAVTSGASNKTTVISAVGTLKKSK